MIKRIQKLKTAEVSILIAYLAIIVLRDPRFFLHPRFWAEEGTFHFANSYTHPWFQALFLPVKGYLNLWANFSTLLAARLVPLERAPILTTIMAFLVQAAVGAWIATTTAPIGNRWYKKAAMLLIVLFVPLTSEMWLNTINSMEVFCVITFMILIEAAQQGRVRRFLGYLFLLVGGLTGLYSVLLTPFFFITAWMEKSRLRWVQVGVLTVSGLVQSYLILSAKGIGALGFRFSEITHFDPQTMVTVFFSQSIGLILIGFNHMKTLVGQWGALQASHPTVTGVLSFGLFILEISLLIYLVIKFPRNDRIVYAGVYLWLVVALVFLAIDRDKAIFTQPGYGQRHFFAPDIILGFMLLASIDGSPGTRWKFRSLFATVLLSAAILVGMTQFEPTLYRYPGWPSWSAQVATWRSNPNYNLVIWPEPWVMNPIHPPQETP
jgi:hypothetical protein